MSEKSPPTRRFTLVLAGGGSRGAYEAGVLRFVLHELPRRTGERIAPRIVCGTSAGALNGTAVAARTGDPDGALVLSRVWQTMSIDQIYTFDAVDVLRSPLRMLGWRGDERRSLVDAAPLHRLVREAIPWGALQASLDSGRLEALVVAATEVAAGRCYYFLDRRVPGRVSAAPNAEEILVHTRIQPEHCLASAAIPFLFPPVTIGDVPMVDGGLRQNTPLTPALRLGARRVLVVGVKRALPPAPAQHPVRAEDLSLTFLLGKALNALMLDPIEHELHRVDRISQLLDWGSRVYGADFAERLSAAAASGQAPAWRVIRTCMVRPSEDLGAIAAHAWASGRVRANRPTRLLLRTIASQETSDEADLLSYLLFDSAFTAALEQLGFEDAARQEEVLARFLGVGEPEGPPEPPVMHGGWLG